MKRKQITFGIVNEYSAVDMYSINWDLSLTKYYQIQGLLGLITQANNQLEIVSILADCPFDSLLRMNSSEFDELWNLCLQGPLNGSAEPFERIQIIDDKEYHFIDITKLTIGEYADMDVLNNHPNSIQQLHKMMAILWRPAGAHYSEGFEERAQLFLEKMPLSVVLQSSDFFLLTARTFLTDMLDSLL